MNALDFIRSADGVETPAPGSWNLRPVQHHPRNRAAAVSGRLVIADQITASRLIVTVRDVLRDAIAIDATLREAHRDGRWRFSGIATRGGDRTPVDVHVRYHGAFPSRGGAIVWLTLAADIDPRSRSGGRLHVGRRRRRVHIDIDVNADSHDVLPVDRGAGHAVDVAAHPSRRW